MISVLTGLATLISFIQIILLIVHVGKSQNFYQFTIYIMVLICNASYFAMGLIESVDAAILCNDVTYLGGIVMPLLVLTIISELCDIDIPQKLYISLVIFSIVVLGLIFTTGYNELFYERIYIEKVYGVTRMGKVPGQLHFTYKILLVVEIIICIATVGRAIHLKKNFTKRSAVAILSVLIGPAIVYLVEKAMNCPIELMPYCYVIVMGFHLSMVSRMSMYDMSSSVASALEKLDEYGYITFDLKKKLMNCNQMALHMFPELENTKIDSTVEKTNSIFYQEIIRWMDLPDLGEYNEKKINVGERSIICTVRKIHNGTRKKVIGYSVELIDNSKQENYIKLINNYNDELERQVEEKTSHIRKMQRTIITGIASMVESRDNSTGGHIRRTSECVRVFVELVGKDERFPTTDEYLDAVIRYAPMHDLGKIAVDDVILRKPGKFTDEEYAIMKTHSEKGAKIVSEVLDGVEDDELVKIAVNVAHYHHEKWDGSGYPTGISGTNIPLEARIMALADVFDALVSKRCYKAAYNYDRAFRIIEESLGSHFDPELGKLFIECRPKLEELYNNLPE